MKRFLTAALLTLSIGGNVFAADYTKEIDDRTAKIMSDVIATRRKIHQTPELGNREFKTAKLIAEKLRSYGLEVRENVAKTGVVGVLRGAKSGATVALRADMDALPVTERVNLPYASKETAEYNGQKVGVMHACGHDAHVAMLLGAAQVLSQMKDKVAGNIVFVFQPAEEGAPAGEEGGADLMVKEGVMDNPKVDAIFGIHIASGLEAGKILYRSGGFMAASDWFTIKIKGRQTHGAYPWSGVDPIVVAAQVINSIQTVVSRNSELTRSPVVISVGRINGGIRENIIPEELTMSGTIRTLDTEVQKDVHEKLKRTVEKVAESMGAKAEVTIESKTPVTYNTPELVRQMLPSLEKAAGGRENIGETLWVTGAEDFAFYGAKAPAFFFNVGGRSPNTKPKDAPPHHTPDFYLDDSRLDVGVKAFCHIVFDYKK